MENLRTDRLVDEVIKELKLRLRREDDRDCLLTGRPRLRLLGAAKTEEEEILASGIRLASSVEKEETVASGMGPACFAEDWDVLAAVRLSTAAMVRAALLLPGDLDSECILRSLMEGKKVYILENGLEYRRYRETACKTAYQKLKEYEDRICRLGCEILPDLPALLELVRLGVPDVRGRESRIQENRSQESRIGNTPNREIRPFALPDGCLDYTQVRLLKESDLGKIRDQPCRTVLVGRKTIITPLAQDYIQNHNLVVERQ